MTPITDSPWSNSRKEGEEVYFTESLKKKKINGSVSGDNAKDRRMSNNLSVIDEKECI